MRLDSFNYDLPRELIADQPAAERSASRLLVLEGQSGAIGDMLFGQIDTLLEPGDLLVMNDTRVIPARLFGVKASGGKVELLVERIVDKQRALVHLRASKSPRDGSVLTLEGGHTVTVGQRAGDLFEVAFASADGACGAAGSGDGVMAVLNAVGHMPLPPYLARSDNGLDRERYQTVYARTPGAVAAPTAGLHFDEALLARLHGRGVSTAFVTLHVGAGTFQPVRTQDITQHRMHSEVAEVSDAVCQQVAATRAAGKRVIAVGTTSVRCLETAGRDGRMRPFCGETDIFIYPGYQFRQVDALITNFHLPESTLLMLVSAFAGYRHAMAAYRHAVAERYRFFSYGDAMFISRNPAAVEDIPA